MGAAGKASGMDGGGGARASSRRLSRYWSFFLALGFIAAALGMIFSMSLAAVLAALPFRRRPPGFSAAFLRPFAGRPANAS
ncbi:hypothetical protein OsJ_17128 [Oryza sativa Japonica Group]|uniref:Uncharacterized protein n=1 Tax=Oryza sativa subsp. japonica TaxID=39947 RepID=Q65XE7_ORYSJ|nr:unknown protein [Oryza sativa Japonica Group]EEE62339.1 hypothetical protein OsJ_17128 [Oryza sativa Japonica Group]